MATATPTTHSRGHAFQGFDRSVEEALGADMRLIYGMAVPILMVIGLVVILALSPAVWLVASIMVIELAMLVGVVYGFMGMMDEDGDDQAESGYGGI